LVPWLRATQAPRHQGTQLPWLPGPLVPRHLHTKPAGSLGPLVVGNPGSKAPADQARWVPGCRGIQVPGSQATQSPWSLGHEDSSVPAWPGSQVPRGPGPSVASVPWSQGIDVPRYQPASISWSPGAWVPGHPGTKEASRLGRLISRKDDPKGPSRPGPLGSTDQENTRHDERARPLEILRSGGPSQEAKRQHPPAQLIDPPSARGRAGGDEETGDRRQETGGPHAAGEGSSHAPSPTLSPAASRPDAVSRVSCLVSPAKGRAIFESDRIGRRCRSWRGPSQLDGARRRLHVE
jgi:hypothetical protein